MTQASLALPRGRLAARRRHGSRNRLALAASVVVAGALLSPILFLALDARSAGWSEIRHVLFRSRSLVLLRNTVVLSLLVVVLSATVGVASAWWVERRSVPGRKIWTVLLVLPVAIPDFVISYAWHSAVPGIDPLLGATLVMTLGTYPLVFLPTVAALRRADPAMEDVAHSLGVGRSGTFLRVTAPLLRTAVLGGSVLVVLTVLSEYGAFEILRYQTFTTEIFTEFQFEPQAAGALSLSLVLLGLLVLSADLLVPRRTSFRTAPRHTTPPAGLGRRAALPVASLGALVLLAVGVPVGTIAYWLVQGGHSTLPAAATVAQATWASVRFSASGAGVAVLAAVPVAMMSFRRQSAPRLLLERATFVTQAVPGVVVALSLVFFATRYAYALYQTSALLVAAYAVLHFPLALVCVKASVAQAPPRLADVGRSLGRRPASVFLRITLPLIAPGLLAGFCLVFLTAVTELTATLVLAPIGTQTLATQFWAYQSAAAYGAAAPYALVIVALAALPGALLALWFDRERRGGLSL